MHQADEVLYLVTLSSITKLKFYQNLLQKSMMLLKLLWYYKIDIRVSNQ